MTKPKITALYARTNRNGIHPDHINNIAHQIEFLKKYASENGYKNCEVFADADYSGLDFDRPSWNRLIDEIKKGNVENVIVKSKSRIGRSTIKVMEYEFMFYDNVVRLIGITDNTIPLADCKFYQELYEKMKQYALIQKPH